jgi:hypothetical protein
MKKDMTMNDVMASLTMTEYVIMDRKEGLVLVCDRGKLEEGIAEYTKRIFRIVDHKQGLVLPIDLDGARAALIEKVRDKVDLNQMLDEALKTVKPKDVIEALRRVCEPKGDKRIEPGKGCYSLLIHGRKGQRTIELVLV